ncbi:MAG: hypothetical protein IKR92_02845 [Alphaproteobacteria bacterium]|nr:hypothetical protein [Alphaproteobacteria bacterium]
MNYKEKHSHQLRHAFKVLALATAMLIPVGCADKKEKVDEQQTQGLMDKTPLKTNDKYGASVTLYLVDVPVYERFGERKPDQYMLTRGLQKSDYVPGNKRYTRKAYFNNSDDAVYVQVDENNAVVTEKGFVGLFVDADGKVVVVSDDHITDFVRDRTARRDEAREGRASGAGERIAKARQQSEENDSTQLNIVTDSIHSDTVKMAADSVLSPKAQPTPDTVLTDTLTALRQNLHE